MIVASSIKGWHSTTWEAAMVSSTSMPSSRNSTSVSFIEVAASTAMAVSTAASLVARRERRCLTCLEAREAVGFKGWGSPRFLRPRGRHSRSIVWQ